MENLAIFGGKPAIEETYEDLFKWPIITKEDEDAVLDVVRNNLFSLTNITTEFQKEFAEYHGVNHALAFTNGTQAIEAAMFAIGLSMGDEIICPTKTYWGSAVPAFNFGAIPVFCNIDNNLSMDPDDIERCITPRTKAIIAVHYFGYPCDMDRIMEIANRYGLKVIEDVSHAQGGLYKGKKLGTFGDVGAMSLMSFKSFAAGELGVIVTDDKNIYERALAFGHYERNNAKYITSEELAPYSNIAIGGIKGRANQVSTALARVQLKYYDERCKEIRRAMNYFWDLMADVKGIKAIRVDESTGSNMAGWYSPHGLYVPEELGGLSSKRFCKAMRAEGVKACHEGGNFCLHTHPYFKDYDRFGNGKPTRIAFTDRDPRIDDDACRRSELIQCIQVPWFKHFEPEIIEKYVAAFRKVSENYELLLKEDTDGAAGGRWYGTTN